MVRRARPRIVADILSNKQTLYRHGKGTVVLVRAERGVFSIAAPTKALVVMLALLTFITGSVVAPTPSSWTASAQAPTNAEERAALEAQLKDLEKQISEYEGEIATYRAQGGTLKGQIQTLNSKISKINLQIKAINLTISQLDTKIGETKGQIEVTEGKIASNRTAIGDLLTNIYKNDQATLIEIFLHKPRLSDFFGDLHNITSLQEELRVKLQEVVNLNEELNDQKEQLSLARADAHDLKQYQTKQRAETETIKKEKDTLLVVTKGKESEYQALLKETRESAAEIRSRLFQLLGGGELSFEEAFNYARLASNATGIRAAFILAVLDRESALGKNVGRCSYTTAMHPKRDIPLYLEITRELGIDPATMMVSCANADGAYGGAMGPAQFIPSTWMLYKDRVAKVTGNSPASPWKNADAFVATALYLSDSYNSATCGKYAAEIPSQERTLRERCAAAQYYAGSRWYYYRWAYGEPVVQRADKFQKDIDIISA